MHPNQQLIAELTRAKCAIQLRTIGMVMGLPTVAAPQPSPKDQTLFHEAKHAV